MPYNNMEAKGSRRRSTSYSTDGEDDRRRRRRDRESRDPYSHEGRRRPRDDPHDRKRDDRRRHRSASPESDHRRRRHDYNDRERPSKRRRGSSHSPPPRPAKLSHTLSRTIAKRSRAPLTPQDKAYKEETGAIEKAPEVEKQKPNFSNSGKLAAETNTVAGTNIVLKYNEPPEARKPPSKDAWRLYVFKGSDLLETVEIGGRSCWLVGRERMVVDFPVDHPSCSKQHAVIQFRHVVKTNDFGDKDGRVRSVINF